MPGVFWLAVLVLLVVTAFKRSGAMALIKGHAGEWLVRKRLENALPAEDYSCLHDVTLPGPSGSTQIDHVVVSRYGIFVIETKHLSGWIFGSARDAQWTQTFHRRKHRFQNPLRQNFAHVKALASVLGLDGSHFQSVVVFTGAAEFKTPMPSEVTGLSGLAPHIRSVRTPVFDDARLPGLVAAIAAFYLITTQMLDGLKGSLPGAAAPARAQTLQRENRAQWEASLLCAYSIDSGRCACYEPNGPKADIPLEQCIEQANKGSILTQ